MKLFKITFLFAILISLFSCNKKEELPEDNIIYKAIDKTITELVCDSIDGACYNLIFEIEESKQSDCTVSIRLNNQMVLCDAYTEILANIHTGNALPLYKDHKISEHNNWAHPHGISLDDFAGKGEMYIGYRAALYPSGQVYYNYGWIKIELSSDKKTLKIIDRATNYTENKYIKTGQNK